VKLENIIKRTKILNEIFSLFCYFIFAKCLINTGRKPLGKHMVPKQDFFLKVRRLWQACNISYGSIHLATYIGHCQFCPDFRFSSSNLTYLTASRPLARRNS
jgi:hypothetical protein